MGKKLNLKSYFLYSIILLIISPMTLTHSFELNTDKMKSYKNVFPTLTSTETITIPDTISDNPVNTKILKAYNGKDLLGYIRNIDTTTGCNSACLPISYTSFYGPSGDYLKVLSESGLTKINHAPFTLEDYSQLELILSLAPIEFGKVKHPKEMTDAISGETLKQFQPLVVKGAAYSTLRIHLYNQDTLKVLKKTQKVD